MEMEKTKQGRIMEMEKTKARADHRNRKNESRFFVRIKKEK